MDVSTGAERASGSASTVGDVGFTSFAVDEDGNYAPLRVNNDGELLVDVTVTSGADKAEDSVHTSTDVGAYVLAVRQDTLASSVSADGDYASFKVDALGALYVRPTAAQTPTNTSFLTQAVVVDTTPALLVPSSLANRKRIIIQNASATGKTLYLGSSIANATVAAGIRVSPGGTAEFDLAPGALIYASSSVAALDCRIMEFAQV